MQGRSQREGVHGGAAPPLGFPKGSTPFWFHPTMHKKSQILEVFSHIPPAMRRLRFMDG